MSARTRGPWHIDGETYVIGANGSDVAFLPAIEDGYEASEEAETVRANAALIAAAPDLLKAMQALFDNCAMIHSRWGSHSNQKEADKAIADAKAAMAKAEGNS